MRQMEVNVTSNSQSAKNIREIRRNAKSIERQLAGILAVVQRTDQFMEGKRGARRVSRNLSTIEGKTQRIWDLVEKIQTAAAANDNV